MHTFCAMIIAACAIARAGPVLNIYPYSTPNERAAIGEQITFQTDVYSTSDTIELLSIRATVEPYVKFAISGIMQSDKLGEAICAPTLIVIDCVVPIKRMHIVSVIGVIDTPALRYCLANVTFHIVATLPDRRTVADHRVMIDNGANCHYLPIVSVH